MPDFVYPVNNIDRKKSEKKMVSKKSLKLPNATKCVLKSYSL